MGRGIGAHRCGLAKHQSSRGINSPGVQHDCERSSRESLWFAVLIEVWRQRHSAHYSLAGVVTGIVVDHIRSLERAYTEVLKEQRREELF